MAHVPPDTGFATKPTLALAMIDRHQRGRAVCLGHGRQRLRHGRGRDGLAAGRQGLCAWRRATSQFNSWGAQPPVAGTATEIASNLNPSAWQRLSAGAGAQGERLFDWAYLELADLEAAEYNENLSGLWTRGLLIRRNIADGELVFFATWCPAGTPIAVLVTVEGQRWAIRTASRRPKTNSVSITTRPVPGTAGIDTSRLSCWPLP